VVAHSESSNIGHAIQVHTAFSASFLICTPVLHGLSRFAVNRLSKPPIFGMAHCSCLCVTVHKYRHLSANQHDACKLHFLQIAHVILAMWASNCGAVLDRTIALEGCILVITLVNSLTNINYDCKHIFQKNEHEGANFPAPLPFAVAISFFVV
jgi:hypothetical protein